MRRLLAEKGWKASVLAEKAGVAAARVSEIYRTEHPFVPLLQKFADAFGVPLSEFFLTEEQARVIRKLTAVNEKVINEETLLERVLSKMPDILRSTMNEARQELSLPEKTTKRAKKRKKA